MGHCFCLTRHFTMSVRIDKWLWAARFFKTRSLARNAVQGGKVRLNDTRAKPAKTLEVGDELRIQRGEETWMVHVESLSDRRGPASEAQKLYRETEDSRVAREALAERRKAERAAMGDRHRRPDKRQRRQIIRFRQDRDG